MLLGRSVHGDLFAVVWRFRQQERLQSYGGAVSHADNNVDQKINKVAIVEVSDYNMGESNVNKRKDVCQRIQKTYWH